MLCLHLASLRVAVPFPPRCNGSEVPLYRFTLRGEGTATLRLAFGLRKSNRVISQ